MTRCPPGRGPRHDALPRRACSLGYGERRDPTITRRKPSFGGRWRDAHPGRSVALAKSYRRPVRRVLAWRAPPPDSIPPPPPSAAGLTAPAPATRMITRTCTSHTCLARVGDKRDEPVCGSARKPRNDPLSPLSQGPDGDVRGSHTVEGRVAQAVGVQVPPLAPKSLRHKRQRVMGGDSTNSSKSLFVPVLGRTCRAGGAPTRRDPSCGAAPRSPAKLLFTGSCSHPAAITPSGSTTRASTMTSCTRRCRCKSTLRSSRSSNTWRNSNRPSRKRPRRGPVGRLNVPSSRRKKSWPIFESSGVAWWLSLS